MKSGGKRSVSKEHGAAATAEAFAAKATARSATSNLCVIVIVKENQDRDPEGSF